MATSYVGEIRLFAGTFAPQGWLFCQGQAISISDNQTLFQLIGTTYGGDGTSNFQIPDLRSRLAIHQGNENTGGTYTMGQAAGTEQVTLTTNQLPAHNHLAAANNNVNSGTATAATGAIFGSPNTGDTVYSNAAPATALSPKAVSPTANGNQAHTNIKPYQCVNFIISLYGVYPSQN